MRYFAWTFDQILPLQNFIGTEIDTNLEARYYAKNNMKFFAYLQFIPLIVKIN